MGVDHNDGDYLKHATGADARPRCAEKVSQRFMSPTCSLEALGPLDRHRRAGRALDLFDL